MHNQQEYEDLKGKVISVPAYDMIDWADLLTAMSKRLERIEEQVYKILFATCCIAFVIFFTILAVVLYMRW